MNRIRSLLYKEWLHHQASLIFILILVIIGFAIQVLNAGVERKSLSLIQAEGYFLIFFIPLAAVVLGHRLVVLEYHSHTQLFIEALPIRRVEMILIKYAVGLTFLLIITLTSITLVLWMASWSEHISTRFIQILFSRSILFVYFIWCFLFTMGLLGKFRIPIYLAIGFGLVFLLETTELEFLHISPVALVDPVTFPFERNIFPEQHLFFTFLAGTACLTIALILALFKEGSLAESMAQRMTQREKAMVSILFVGFLTAFILLEEKKEKKPYQFMGEGIIESEIIPVKILYIHDHIKPAATTLLQHMESKLTGLQKALDLDRLPSIRIAYGLSLDKNTFETAELNESDGVLIRANFPSFETINRDDFTSYLIKAVLDNITKNRSRFEPKRWLHDGFAGWWARIENDNHEMILLRSLMVLRHQELSTHTLKKWVLFRERNGEFLSEALACSGLLYLEEEMGSDVVISLAKAVFSREHPNDIRETIYEQFHPMPRIFTEETGKNWDHFIIGWKAWLDRQLENKELKTKLNAIPVINGKAWVDFNEGSIRDIRYSFESDRLLEKNITCALLHLKLTPFDDELAPGRIKREEFKFNPAEGRSLRNLMGRYGSGERVFIALEWDSATLDIPIRIFSTRINLP